MHEVRVTVPTGAGPAVARVALGCGIERVSVSQAHVHGPDRDAEVVSVETSTPRARAFTKALMTSGLMGALAAAVQSGVFPVWAGIGLVLGFPEPGVTAERFAAFGINIAVILAVTMAAYGLVGIRHPAGTRGAR